MEGITFAEQLDLFRCPLLAALALALVAPWIGAYLHVRRASFHGIVLPQFAAAGVVFSYAILAWWIERVGLGGLTLDEALASPHGAATFCLAWGAIFTAAGLATLGGRPQSEAARAAASFALASALVFLLGRVSPIGRGHVDDLLQGEALGVGLHELEVLLLALALAAAGLARGRRPILAASYDPDFARVLGLPVRGWTATWHALVGLVVVAGTLTLGPVLVFGLLVVPPLAARRWSHSMASFEALSVAFGAVAALSGMAAALAWDLPFGPAIVGTAGALLAASRVAALGRGSAA